LAAIYVARSCTDRFRTVHCSALIDLPGAASSIKSNSSPQLMLPAFSLPCSQKRVVGV